MAPGLAPGLAAGLTGVLQGRSYLVLQGRSDLAGQAAEIACIAEPQVCTHDTTRLGLAMAPESYRLVLGRTEPALRLELDYQMTAVALNVDCRMEKQE